MGLKINTIITLENNEKYVVLNETMYGGTKYFLVMGVDNNKNIIPNNIAILEEIIEGQDIYVDRVRDQELIIILTRILKAQLESSNKDNEKNHYRNT